VSLSGRTRRDPADLIRRHNDEGQQPHEAVRRRRPWSHHETFFVIRRRLAALVIGGESHELRTPTSDSRPLPTGRPRCKPPPSASRLGGANKTGDSTKAGEASSVPPGTTLACRSSTTTWIWARDSSRRYRGLQSDGRNVRRRHHSRAANGASRRATKRTVRFHRGRRSSQLKTDSSSSRFNDTTTPRGRYSSKIGPFLTKGGVPSSDGRGPTRTSDGIQSWDTTAGPAHYGRHALLVRAESTLCPRAGHESHEFRAEPMPGVARHAPDGQDTP